MNTRLFLLLPLLYAAWAATEPSGAHPRIWLTTSVLNKMRAAASTPSSAIAAVIQHCKDIQANPGSYSNGQYMGWVWTDALGSCALAYRVTNNQTFGNTAMLYWNALLEDFQNIGDRQGGNTAVQHDSGYPIRTFGVYAGLGYDWLHDHPWMSQANLTRAQTRFQAWLSWYNVSGYRNDFAGSNYFAGYLFASTIISIAQGSEGGSSATTWWHYTTDTLWNSIVIPEVKPNGMLHGGDWVEGWEYGPLSVLEHCMGALALEQQGMSLPDMHTWCEQLVQRWIFALTPITNQTFCNGDTQETSSAMATASGEVLLAVIAGPTNETTKQLARYQLQTVLHGQSGDNFFQAFAEANNGTTTSCCSSPTPTTYYAKGAETVYTRGSWTGNTLFAAFVCRPIDSDHQPPNAGNFVFRVGAADVIVDPSPYGSQSSFTSNAPGVDTSVGPYSPSQGDWGTPGMTYLNLFGQSITQARCDYQSQFALYYPSDIPRATRDLIAFPHDPEGTLVIVDRVNTTTTSKSAYFRFRTLAPLTLDSQKTVATGTWAGASISIQTAYATSNGTRAVSTVPRSCSVEIHHCDDSQLDDTVYQYSIVLPGPLVDAVHVIDGSSNKSYAGAFTKITGGNSTAVLIDRKWRLIVALAKLDVASLTYSFPSSDDAYHSVVDAPADANGKTYVAGALVSGQCTATISKTNFAGATQFSVPLIFSSTKSSCGVSSSTVIQPVGSTTTTATTATTAATTTTATTTTATTTTASTTTKTTTGSTTASATTSTTAAPATTTTTAAPATTTTTAASTTTKATTASATSSATTASATSSTTTASPTVATTAASAATTAASAATAAASVATTAASAATTAASAATTAAATATTAAAAATSAASAATTAAAAATATTGASTTSKASLTSASPSAPATSNTVA